MVGTDRDDELARTATAPVGSTGTQPAAPADPVGPTLGRYKLERELGAGGMGVVHAAFDPDLERRVALKVLRESAGSSEARQRLLREARAMARLSHPNVVTVHEVASANGRDYVAMEMIDGQSLAEWMRAEQRPENEIIDAFVAAGRGLAAAHAEGIVHRDFKPHNILRHRNGRIAVTDFGLARDAETPLDPLAETREVRAPVAGTAVSSTTPSSPLAGLTITGSVLGTPAYMAPEQWSGGAVTQATDQFAFCVALWEALAGERPFKGPTVEKLREEVQGGPAQLDVSKIPRRLRPALLRGLDPDPARRWPSMEALLGAMTYAEKSSKGIYVVAGAAIAAGIAVLVTIKLAGGSEPAIAPDVCRAPAQSVDRVLASAAKLRQGQKPAAELIESDARAWQAARERACAIDVAHREPQLACLDAVLARLDSVASGLEPVVGMRDVDVGYFLIDPAVCAIKPPPRLAARTTPQMRATMAAVLLDAATPGRPSAAAVKAAIEKAEGDPCASVYARYVAIRTGEMDERERHLAEAAEQGERCLDDRVRAESALMHANLALESGSLGTSITSKVKIAELAAQRVMQEDVQGALETLRSEIAKRADQLDEAISRSEAAAAHYAKRGRVEAEMEARMKVLDIKQTRATPKDFADMADAYEVMKKRAIEKLGERHDTVRDIERNAADWQYRSGDVEGAMQRLEAAYKPEPNAPSRKIKGKVVDERGAPVAGARVAAGSRFAGTATQAAAPWSDGTRFVTTGPDGTFEIPDAVEFGTIIAQAGELRSLPMELADDVTLKLAPTSTVSGRVDLHGEPHQAVTIVAIDPDGPNIRYGWPSPVAADGTFQLAGVPRKRLKVFAAIDRNATRQAGYVEVTVKGPKVEGVKLEVMRSKRVVHVIVRSTVGISVGNAAVIISPGKIPSMSAKQMRQTMSGINEKAARQIEGERAPAPVVKLARGGDLYATMNEVPEGVASACAIALPQDLADPKLGKKIDANLDKLRIECTPIPDGAEAVVIEVPPFPRLD
jgi:predicted Ser/Thr protein kinase/cell fate (sporulation/competence/biofilm development) regulator YlbF (YheA/YmcA/DUF963 family)